MFSKLMELSSLSSNAEPNSVNWLSSSNFFSGGGKIYCYANFYCYSIVFGPNFREGRKFSGRGESFQGGAKVFRGGKLPQGGAPLWKKASKGLFVLIMLASLLAAIRKYLS